MVGVVTVDELPNEERVCVLLTRDQFSGCRFKDTFVRIMGKQERSEVVHEHSGGRFSSLQQSGNSFTSSLYWWLRREQELTTTALSKPCYISSTISFAYSRTVTTYDYRSSESSFRIPADTLRASWHLGACWAVSQSFAPSRAPTMRYIVYVHFTSAHLQC